MDELEQRQKSEGHLLTATANTEAVQRYLPEEFYAELGELLRRHGRTAARQDKIVSSETTEARRESLVRSFRELRGLGYKLQSPHNLKQKHVEALGKYWEGQGLSASTIANRLSVLRTFASWIGKPGLVQQSRDFVEDPESVRRKQVAVEDKSWSAKNIDQDALMVMVGAYDWRVSLQLRLMRAFGLRRKEAVMFRPLRADMGVALRVRDGTKGGRERVIPIETEEQRTLLEEAKSKVTHPNQSIGWPDLTLAQAIRRFNYVLERFGITKGGLGITSHGLRHQHLNDLYERIAGVPAPVRRDNVTADIDRFTHDIARARVSEEAGHTRLGITSAYIGARTSIKRSPEVEADIARFKTLAAQDNLSDDEAAEFGRLVKKLNGSL